jgi:hypothetical protein
MDFPFTFSVDKETSLKIVRELAEKMELEKKINPKAKYCNNHTDDAIWKSFPFTHKLAMTEIFLDEIGYPKKSNKISDYYDILVKDEKTRKKIEKKYCHKSKQITLYKCATNSKNGEPRIWLKFQPVDTCLEGDVCKSNFIYDETIKCWIIKNYGCGDKYGIYSDVECITILDFSDYFTAGKFKYSIDLEKSLEIIRDLSQKISAEKEDEFSCCVHYTIPDYHDPKYSPLKTMQVMHKLKIIEINIHDMCENIDEKNIDEKLDIGLSPDIRHYYDALLRNEHYDCYNISKFITIFGCIIKSNKNGDIKIKIKADFEETYMECETTEISFVYNDILQCWLIMKIDGGEYRKGIDGENGCAYILDFSDYFTE